MDYSNTYINPSYIFFLMKWIIKQQKIFNGTLMSSWVINLILFNFIGPHFVFFTNRGLSDHQDQKESLVFLEDR